MDSFKGAVLAAAYPARKTRLYILPMRTDERWEEAYWRLYASIVLGDDSLINRVLMQNRPFRHGRRNKYFEEALTEIPNNCDVFLDPDTGLETPWGTAGKEHVKTGNVRMLLTGSQRVVALYQHQFRTGLNSQVLKGNDYLIYAVDRLQPSGDEMVTAIYGGGVSMIFAGTHDRIEAIREKLIEFAGPTADKRVISSLSPGS
jgi:hypothetical protein